ELKSRGKAGSPAGQPRWGAKPTFLTLRLSAFSIESHVESLAGEITTHCNHLSVRKAGLPRSLPVLHQQDYLAKALVRLHARVRLANLFQPVNSIDDRGNSATGKQWHNLPREEARGRCLLLGRTRTQNCSHDR